MGLGLASSWGKVIPILQKAGHRVIAVQLPEHSLADDVATVKRAIQLVLFAIGLFIISYFGVYPIHPNILIISALVFSVGVALPGINTITPGERFWLFLVGSLWGVLGAITSLSWQVLKKNSAIKVVKLSSVQAKLRTINLGIFHPLTNNMSLESVRFQFAVCFAVTGTIGYPWSNISRTNKNIRYHDWCLSLLGVLIIRSFSYLKR